MPAPAPFDPNKIWNSKTLPTLPAVALRLLELSKDPETEVKAFVDVIRTDPAILAKILKSANSSFFGFKSQVVSVERAVPLLGTTVVTSLALSFSLVESAMSDGPLAPHYSSYWMQSVVQACAAEGLATFTPGHAGLACEYFQSGILIDLGRLVLLKAVPRDYLPCLMGSKIGRRPLHEVESEKLGLDHLDVGERIVRDWHLPEVLALVVRHHEDSPEQIDAAGIQAEWLPLVKAAAVAAAVGDYFCGDLKGAALERLRHLTICFFGFSEERLQEYLRHVKERVDAAADLFAVPADEIGDPADLMAQASEQLAQLAVREHVAGTQAQAEKDLVVREKQVLVEKNDELQKRALRDPLTGVYNRLFLDEALEKEVRRCARVAAPVGVIFCDIDHFKKLNDTYGHPFGDLVLQKVAKAYSETIRDSDTLARYGGEEFVILAVEPTEKGLEKLAERIRARIEAEEILHEGTRVPVTVSVGAAIGLPDRGDAELGKKLVAAADEAMYDSKHAGRNRVHLRSLVPADEQRITQFVLQKRFSRWLVAQRVLDVPRAMQVLGRCPARHVQIGQLALQHGWLDGAAVERILSEQQRSSERFGRIAVRLGLLDEHAVACLLALQLENPADVAESAVQMGFCDRERMNALARQYDAEVVHRVAPAPSAAAVHA